MHDVITQLSIQLDQNRASQLNSDRAIRMPELLQIVPVARQTIYRKIKNGEFPPPIKLSPNGAVCWRLKTVLLWLAEREIESAPSNYSIH